MQQYMLVPPQGSEPADEWCKLGVEAHMRNDMAAADRHYRQALRVDPRHIIATHNHAIWFASQNNLNEALLTMERAMIFDDSFGAIFMNYALMCLEAGRIDDALKAGERAVELGQIDPGPIGKVHPHIVQAMVLGAAGRSSEGIAHYNAALDEDPKNTQAACNACFAQTLSFCVPKELLEQRKRFITAAKFEGTYRKPKINREWPRPLRVGYVGGDFKQHSAAMIFSRVLYHHDRDKVESYLYSTLPVNADHDIYTKKFQKVANGTWRDIQTKTDDEAADLIREDKIDILVDLAAHTAGNRLAIFLRKPAPLQVTAWGFAHGTGLTEIDYFFADPVSVPEGERQFYAEKIYDLPCLVTYEAPDYKFKDSNALPYALNGFITFGSSARYEKISEECLKAFAEILHQVPDAVLRLKDSAYVRPYSIKRVLGIMKGFDVDPKRIQFLIGTSHEEHLQAYRNSDLQLDPFPHCGGIVALEQLYMGLPIITLYGTQPSGRNTSSVLTAMGRTDWIAKTPEEYVEKAVALANDLKTLREARKTLRQEFLDSPVVKGYSEKVEAAYQEIWERDVLKS
jgi:predicted O-linked N-acetylglucosamine transferase (SPINDLY family)